MKPLRERYTPTDVGPIPDDWEAPRLAEVASLITNGFVGTASPHYVEHGGITYLYGTNIRPNRIDLTGVRHVSEAFHQQESKTKLRTGDVLMVQSGHIGTTAVVPPELDGTNCHALILTRPKHELLNSNFLAYYLNSHIGKARLRGLEVGSTILHINTKDLKKFRIPLPAVAEQSAIAAIIKRWDSAVDVCVSLAETAGRQKRALAQQLLTGKRRLPGFSDEWKKRRIDKVCDRVQRRDDGEPHPILMISSTRGWVRQDDMYSRYMAGESAKSYVLLKRGEFAYNKGNSKTYPCGCVFPLKSFETGLVPHVYVCFRFKGEIEPRFYEHYFAADMLARQLTRVINIGVRNNGLLNIRPADFLACEVPVPSVKEQAAIADVLDGATRQVELYQAMKAKLELEKRALMQQLLTGKRRVKLPPEHTNPAKEPAS